MRTTTRRLVPTWPPQDLLRECVGRAGLRNGSKAAQFTIEWELAVRDEHRAISIEEFARWWKISRATAYRRLAVWQQVFSDYPAGATPNDLMGPLLAELRQGGEPGTAGVATA